MSELTQAPEWIGAAVIGAVIAALGYVGKLILEWWAKVHEARNVRRARLIELESLLRATRVSFVIQNTHANRLTSMIKENHPNSIQLEEGYERIFSKAYDKFTPEERELHGIIRSITVNSLRPANRSLLEWLKNDTYFRAQRQRIKTILGKLAKQLADLEAHLILWHAKYETWIPNTPEHSLVYLADEEAHGIGFPAGIDNLVQEVLERGKYSAGNNR